MLLDLYNRTFKPFMGLKDPLLLCFHSYRVYLPTQIDTGYVNAGMASLSLTWIFIGKCMMSRFKMAAYSVNMDCLLLFFDK